MRHTALRTALLCALIIIAISSAAPAAVVYVKWDSPGPTLDGESWATAFHKVQEGITAASPSDEIWVAKGSYAGRVSLRTGVSLYGGFAGIETSRSERDFAMNATIIDLNVSGVAVTALSVTDTAVDGFTIRHRQGSLYGVGVMCSSSSITISNNVITANSDSNGGAIHCSNSTPVIVNNVIKMNSATGNGGAIYCDNSSPVIANNTIMGNRAAKGGGIYCRGTSAPVISNNIVAFNTSGIERSADATGVPVLRNNCVYNPWRADYTGLSAGTGDISVDPEFSSGEYCQVHIAPDSPCRDAGDDSVVQPGWVDMDGQSRTQGAHVDIGADESDGTVWPYTPPIVHVKPTGSDANPGSSWTLAKQTVQSAISAAAAEGGEVWVAAGTYHEQIGLRSFVHVYGGFAGTETSRDLRNLAANVTILDGDFQSGPVVSAVSLTGPSTIDGFTIQRGGGSTGAGIYCTYSSPVISHNVIAGNCSRGIETYEASPMIRNNAISANTKDGIYCSGTRAPIIVNNTITANAGNNHTGGAGITCYLCAPVIVGNIIAFNWSGVYRYAGLAMPVLRNNCVYNPEGDNYRDLAAGVGDISVDPRLIFAEYGRVHIRPDSPCRDTGDDTVIQAGWTDIDGQPRVQGAHVDIGADEYDGTVWTFAPKVVRVRPTGSDANDGSSWSLAKRTVQSAVNAVTAFGGEVWVAAGTYSERITLCPYVYVYGGFAGTETSRDQRNWATNVTILDGTGGDVVTARTGCRLTASGIDGFTIRGGGVGVKCLSASPTVANNVITGNSGGGVYCEYSSATITGNTISANQGDKGVRCVESRFATICNNTITGHAFGGIGCWGLSMTIAGNMVMQNSTTENGGGISCNGSADILDNVVSGNTARQYGGGIYVSGLSTVSGNIVTGNTAQWGAGVSCDSDVNTVTGNTIKANSAAYLGGGVYCYSVLSATVANNMIIGNSASTDPNNYGGGAGICCYASSPTISNNTIAANTTLRDGGGVLTMANSSPIVVNNVVAFNSSGVHNNTSARAPTLRNNCVYGNTGYNYSAVSVGAGDISADPLFVDKANGDYHLTASSPCIDKGLNTAPGLPTFDFEGEGRIFGRTVDMGADEWWSSVFNAREIKGAPEGALVKVGATPVSADWAGAFYVENEERTGGIRVEMAGHPALEDDMVSFTGKVKTSPLGERFVAADTVTPGQGTFDVKPFALANGMLGGGPYGLQDGVWDKQFVRIPDDGYTFDWVQASGLNNIGLLVTVFGNVTHAGDGFFYVDDGSALDDGSGYKGVKVLATGLNFPSEGFVKVTGISSCEKNGDRLVRLLRVRKQEDIATF